MRQAGEYVYVRLSNLHSACYMLTRSQLRQAIRSGGFLVEPHSGRYDLICSAGTDPYTRCGFTRVICLSHLAEFELHHLSNAYLDRVGLDEDEYRLQIDALLEVLRNERSAAELFAAEKPLDTSAWDKLYYEPCRNDLALRVPSAAYEILSIGCGWGKTEEQLVAQGKRVTAIPLDAVIGRLAEARGVTVLPPDFAEAFRRLEGNTFDAILLSDVLQHLPDPVEVLQKLSAYLGPDGVMVGAVPNLNLNRRIIGRLRAKSNKWTQLNGSFRKMGMHRPSALMLKAWLKKSGFNMQAVSYSGFSSTRSWTGLVSLLPDSLTAANIVFTAGRLPD